MDVETCYPLLQLIRFLIIIELLMCLILKPDDAYVEDDK